MRFTAGKVAKRALLPVTTAAVATLAFANPAQAAYNDSFTVFTLTYMCGSVEFVDYGSGGDGGGSNDDYTVVHDLCGDGFGVKAYAWKNGRYLGSRYNGNGYAGPAVIWDPFRAVGNIGGGDRIGLKVCLVHGSNDPGPFGCDSRTVISRDG